MYKALYRKYRPQQFSDVVGQPQVTVTLKNELMAGRISHAYLFTGSRGTGKTTCAKILAKAVNCLDPQNGDPCGKCDVCRGLDDGSVLDVVELDAASNNGVDSIRALIEESNFTPTTAKYRVYIIDEVHMLSVSAFNALLKTLEEPPAHVIFILATTEVHKLLPTILSRCQRFDFRRIAPEDIAGRLEWVCTQENVTIDHDAAMLIAVTADGGMRDALSMELSTILHALDAFQSAQSRMKTMNKRTEMEMTFIRLCTPEMDTSPAALLRRIEALERGGLRRPITPAPSVPAVEAPAAPVQQPETPQNNAPVQPAVKDKPQSTEELAKNAQPFDGWSDIIGYMENYSKSVASAFKGSAAYISGDYMLIEAPQIAFDLLKRASQREKIREAIQQVTGRVYKLGPYKPPAADGEKPKDPLDAFLHDMREAGVEIEEK